MARSLRGTTDHDLRQVRAAVADHGRVVWLDAFLLVNVVPFFCVETLADLEKQLGEGSFSPSPTGGART